MEEELKDMSRERERESRSLIDVRKNCCKRGGVSLPFFEKMFRVLQLRLFFKKLSLSTLFVFDINSTPPIKNNVSGRGDPRRGGANSRVQRSPQGRVERSGLFYLFYHTSWRLQRCYRLVYYTSSFGFWSFLSFFHRLKLPLRLKKIPPTKCFVQKADNNILLFSSFIQVLDFDGSNDAFRCVLFFFFFF